MKNKKLQQSDISYYHTLLVLNKRVKDGTPLRYEDSEVIGNKYTICSLGLCDESLKEKMDGLYPAAEHVCPHDKRYATEDGEAIAADSVDSSGCFYHCRIFSEPNASRERAAVRIQKMWNRLENPATQS